MKITKKLLSVLLAFTLVIGLFLVPTQVVKAVSYGAVPSKVRIGTCNGYDTFSFDLPGYGYSIVNLKANSSKIKVKQTVNHNYRYQNQDESKATNYAEIALCTQKEGTYKVSFDIVDANGAKANSYVVKVYAYDDSAFKSLKLGKNSLSFDTTTTSNSTSDSRFLKGKSGKVQVKMAKGYKLKKIEYGVYNKEKDEIVYTQIKNKAKISYGTLVDEIGNSSSYEYKHKITKYSYWRKPAMAFTYIRVTYTDKYTKAEDTSKFSFYQWVK